jgi:[ribosomal protein S18]-alanine N-acetyltransferase
MRKPRTPAAPPKARGSSVERQRVNLQIRSVQANDFAALYALDQACFAPGIAWSKAELTYFLKYPGNIGLLAEDEAANLAGFAIAGPQRRRGVLMARLITIDVRHDLRRQGVGHTLLAAIEERLRDAGVQSLLLEVAVDNDAAQAFYERHGFARTGRIPGYYLGRIDALVMEKSLQT